MDTAVCKNINQEKLNASLRMLDKMGAMNLERLKETDPEQAKKQEKLGILFENEDFCKQYAACTEIPVAVKLFADHGLELTESEVEAMTAQYHAIARRLIENDGELTDEDLDMISGGWSWMGAFLGLVAGASAGAGVGWVFGGPWAGAAVGAIIGIFVGGNALD